MRAIGRLFANSRPARPPQVPDGYRIYAVGDVHGCDDLLGELLARIEIDHAARGPAGAVLVFLGDLIDRGPSSAAVVERLRTYQFAGGRVVFLTGNHEEVLLRILDGDAQLIPDWLQFGGAECLASYGVDAAHLRRLAPQRALRVIRSAIPEGHAAFLRSFDDTFRAGDYLFVHAGIRPGIPLDEQLRSDLRWIREPFLADRAEHGFVVVHGHTIRPEVEEQSNRIGIDTGAYRFGKLTALGLEGPDRWRIEALSADEGIARRPAESVDSSVLDGVSGQSG